MSKKITYKDTGVDTKEGERAVSLMKDHVKKTFNENVLTGLGSFGSLYKPNLKGIKEPVLVAGSDGVGTKLKLAFLLDKHDTIGIDCVAMCVNDVLCQGADPMFFLDYIATGKVKAEKIEDIVKGVADGCLEGGCALVGGETAEMPDFYQDGEYDMAGFAVGLVDRDKIVNGSQTREGDVIIGIPSSGVHSNGFSLVRKVMIDENDKIDRKIAETLLTPTKIYTKAVKAILNKILPKAMIHITGGGFYENIPRVLPEGLGVKIDSNSWQVPEVFKMIQEKGNIEDKEMFSTFNMGIGLMVIVQQGDADMIMKSLEDIGETSYLIGEVTSKEGVELW